jgi:hypothetical protein
VSIWLFILAATAGGGALILWHAVSMTKHISVEMLDSYAKMLVRAREQKAKTLLASDEQGDSAEQTDDDQEEADAD